jgi:hypothetical protein
MSDASANLTVQINGQNNAGAAFEEVSGQAKKLAEVIGVGLGLDRLKSAVTDVVEAFGKQQAAQAQIAVGLQSTGSAAGVTSTMTDDLAESLSKVTAFSKTSVLEAESLALTFTGITRDIFPKATEATLNLATRFNIDLKQASIELGKALDDPVKGMQALHREGVSFSQSQMDAVKTMVNMNDKAGAQKIIIQELSKEVEGSARAYGQTLPGQLAILNNTFEEVKVKAGALIAQALTPLVSKAIEFIQHNQELITTIGLTALGLLAGAGATYALVTAVGALNIAMTPLLAVFAVIAVIAGVVLYNAIKNVMEAMKSHTDATNANTAATTTNAAKTLELTDAQKKLNEQLRTIQENIQKESRNFTESLEQMVKAHQDKIGSLKDQMEQENQTFAETAADKDKKNTEALAKMTKDHGKKVDNIKDQLDQETAKDWLANQDKVKSLQDALAQENADYADATAAHNAQYQEDVENARKQHDKKNAAFQKQLDEENAFMTKHATDLQGIRAADAQDEYQKLRQSHDDAVAAANDQRDKILANSKATTDGIVGDYNSIPGKIDLSGITASFAGIGSITGSGMAAAFKKAMIDSIKNIPSEIAGLFKPLVDNFVGLGTDLSAIKTQAGEDDFNSHTNGFQKFMAGLAANFMGTNARASGGPVSGNTPYMVGEQGPELFVPSSGGSIVPNNQLSSHGSGGHTFNITNTFTRESDPTSFLRQLSLTLATR